MTTFIVHPRIESSFRVAPGAILHVRRILDAGGLDTEFLDIEGDTAPPRVGVPTREITVLDYLLQYDFRGMNHLQQEENLEFLRLYFERYPEIREYFQEDILVPQVMEDYASY